MFDRCLIITNPGSTESERTTSNAASIKKTVGNLREYKLEDSDFKDTKQLKIALNKLTKQSLIAIAGGDGTVNWIATVLSQLDSPVRQATLLPLWSGNANDLAHMTNGNFVADLSHLLTTGTKTPIYTLAVTVSGNDAKQMVALGYVSFGATAHVMHALSNKSDKERRSTYSKKRRLLDEASAGLLVMARSPRFDVVVNDKQQQLYELAYINGSRIAKLYYTPAKLKHASYTRIALKYRHPLFLGHLLALAKSHIRRATYDQTQYITLKSKAMMQVDGEVFPLDKNTKITIKTNSDPYFFLSTKL